MIVDSSALMAIVNDDTEAEALVESGEPLLFTGDDFAQTDVARAAYGASGDDFARPVGG